MMRRAFTTPMSVIYSLRLIVYSVRLIVLNDTAMSLPTRTTPEGRAEWPFA
jgi:hypothetical protein